MGLVAEHVAGSPGTGRAPGQVQVRAADRRRCHLDDDVVGLLDHGVGDGLDADVAAPPARSVLSCEVLLSVPPRRSRAVAGSRCCARPARVCAAVCGSGTPGPSTASSSRVISVPAPTAASRITTSASPAGHPRVRSRSRRPGSASSTSVLSSMSSGQMPTEWCSFAPTWGPVVVDLAHPGGPHNPHRVEPAVAQHRPDRFGRGGHGTHVPAHAGPVPGPASLHARA